MRLIDADRLKSKITGITKPHEFVEEIDKRPTVKAIPYGFISEYSRRPISNAAYWAIIRMVKAWEEEYGK